MTDDWIKKAACKDADPEIFFPSHEQGGTYPEARAYCARCPVTGECLREALDLKDEFGMRGGLTPEERALIRIAEGDMPRFYGGHGLKEGTTIGWYRERASGVPHCPKCTAAYNEARRVSEDKKKQAVAACADLKAHERSGLYRKDVR